MSKLVWDATAERTYETGTDHGVIYIQKDDGTYDKGVVWNGLTGVDETAEGGEQNPLWADNIKYLNMTTAEEYGLTIKAYMYPDEFAICDGSAEVATGTMIGQQSRRAFGFCYRTIVGNDVKGNDYGYKYHIAYGCKASPSDRSYETVNDNPDAIEFSWDVDCTPVTVEGYKPTCNIIIDSTKFTTQAQKDLLDDLLDTLYGTDGEGNEAGTDPTLPDPDTIIGMLTPSGSGD